MAERGRAIRRRFRSVLADGRTWCESSDPDEVVDRSRGQSVTFERHDTYEVSDGWQPWTWDAPDA